MTEPVEPMGPSTSGGFKIGPIDPDATSDDKLWVLLTYLFTPIVPIILMLMEDKKNRPFIKAHNFQALGLGVIQIVCWALSFTCVTAILGLALWVFQIYLGIQAYNGNRISLPFLTDFIAKQGWG